MAIARKKAIPQVTIGVKVNTPGLNTKDFVLEDLSGCGCVTASGRNQGIDLSGFGEDVRLDFHLTGAPDLLFPDDPNACMGIHGEDACPAHSRNLTGGMFKRFAVSPDRRTLTVIDHNRGNRGHAYRFALHLADGNGQVTTSCDPRIINK